MSDVKERILKILRQPQLAGLATITQDGKPWVRYVMAVAAPDMTIRCATFVNARKVKQIKKDPEVHLTCGVTDPRSMGPYLQIQGRATLNTSKEARHGFWSGMLSAIFSGPPFFHATISHRSSGAGLPSNRTRPVGGRSA